MKKLVCSVTMLLVFLVVSCGRKIQVVEVTLQIMSHQIPVEGVMVEVIDVGKKTTNRDGTVKFSGMKEGEYLISIVEPGFNDFAGKYLITDKLTVIRINLENRIESPKSVNLTVNDSSLTLHWEAPENPNLTHYEILKSVDGVTFQSIAKVNPILSYYQDSNVTNGLIYYYRIIAEDKFGDNSTPSQVVYAIPYPTLSHNLLYSKVNYSTQTLDLFLLQNSLETNLTNSIANEKSIDYDPVSEQIIFTADVSGKEQIYLMDLTERRPRQLTDLPNGATHPRFSPDGKAIIYLDLADINLYLMTVEGTNHRKLVQGTNADWSPMGDRVIFITSDIAGINNVFMMEADGRGVRQVTFSSTPVESPAWSPNGEEIAYVRLGQVCLLDVLTGREFYLTNLAGTYVDQLAWSLDGTEIFYVTDDNPEKIPSIYVHSLAGESIPIGQRIVGNGLYPVVF